MYWNSSDYERMSKIVIDVYLDYGITSFPVDEKEICRKLGVKLLPYSDFPEIVKKVSDDAFYVPPTTDNPPIIFNNDLEKNEGRRRYSVFHELKHFVCGDTEETLYDENMADFFARYFMCPIPVLICRNVRDIATIMSDYNVGLDAAGNVLSNLKNRRMRYGNKIFEHEQPIVDLIERGGVT
ncbi:MAG: ImmA/IrrE family metallo-endopeptidase [Lachnospiraceae bacterium]|nr:ImmA/IrrE family metallo-endopeptidase [Lachnospiraceae bacterium]